MSRRTAQRFWGDDDPIGKMLHRQGDTRNLTVVGVVGDVRNNALSQELPALYYAATTRVWPLMDVVVRTAGKPEAALPAVRRKIRDLDAELPMSNVRSMEDWVSNSAAQPRINAVLVGVFAAVALLIAAIGVYGVLAYSVNQRTREIGLRMALGAQQSNVLRLIVSEGMMVGLAGIAVGLAGAYALSRALAALLVRRTGARPADVRGCRRHTHGDRLCGVPGAGMARLADRPDRRVAGRVAAGPFFALD